MLSCIKCNKHYDDGIRYTCECGGLLECIYSLEHLDLSWDNFQKKPLSVWRYASLLPAHIEPVSFEEGGTTLHHCKHLAKKLGIKNLYVKNEGENPTGSFKDRGMTVGVTMAKEFNCSFVACASTGNTSASLAAYAAKAQMTCAVLLPKAKIAFGKLSQALAYGAKIIAIEGNFDNAMDMVKEATYKWDIYLLNSLNPYRLEGQKTLGFEVIEQLNYKSPDRIILPVGNAGNISAIWKGFRELDCLGLLGSLPKMCGVQAAGAAPIANMIEENLDTIHFVDNPETIATAIRIGKPVNWPKAIAAINQSKGTAISISDKEILSAQRLLAKTEGLFVEPASASSIAGIIHQCNAGDIDKDETIVCVTTGNGLKDPDIIVDNYYGEVNEIKPELIALKGVLFNE